MRSEHRQHVIDRRNAHHYVQDRQVHATEHSGKQIDPKAGQRKMQTTNDYEEQRYNMNQLKHKTNLSHFSRDDSLLPPL